MKEDRKENAVKTEDTSEKKTESRKMSDDEADQVSGGVKMNSYQSNPIKPRPDVGVKRPPV